MNPSTATRGREFLFSGEKEPILRALWKDFPDVTLDEYADRLRINHAIDCHSTTVCKALKRLELTRKKTLRADEQDREDVKEQRKTFLQQFEGIALQDILVLDECGSNTSMTRKYARSPKGTRAYASASCRRGANTTLLGVISGTRYVTGMNLEGSLDSALFVKFVNDWLVPELKEGQVVVMDNLSFHKVKGVREAIEGAGARLIYLPPYSPDFSPIEKMWSKLKTFLRSKKARTEEELDEAIQEGLDAVTTSDLRGWFVSCGYEV